MTPYRAAFLMAALLLAGCRARERQPPPAADKDLLPGGYSAVVDTTRGDPGHFQVTQEGDLLRVTTGPAGIAWRSDDVVTEGDFLAEATFTVYGAPPGYREGYGVFVGGADLEGPDARYACVLVRPNGDALVRRRMGSEADTLMDWTPHTAVQRVTRDGDEPVNVVGIIVVGDEVRFLVNGVVVYRMAEADAQPYGAAGLCIDHRLDVRVASWYLGAPPADAPAAAR